MIQVEQRMSFEACAYAWPARFGEPLPQHTISDVDRKWRLYPGIQEDGIVLAEARASTKVGLVAAVSHLGDVERDGIECMTGELIGHEGWIPVTREHYIFAIILRVPREYQEEFDAFYAEEHMPIVLQNPSWLACRRYRGELRSSGAECTVVAHHLGTLAALNSKERKRAATPWRARIAQQEWFEARREFLVVADAAGPG